MPYSIDLHTHSIASPDGALRVEDYRQVLDKGHLDYIAITDHNTIEMAEQFQAELGRQIIVGEEITTQEGEVIGLYLTEVVTPGLSLRETIRAIKEQGGLVYVPHPFETVRKGLAAEALDAIAKDVDIVEVRNGRAVFQNYGPQAVAWSRTHNIPGAASSDAHGPSGWAKTYSTVSEAPTPENLPSLLQGAKLRYRFMGFRGLLYPKYNRLRKRLQRVT